MQDQFGNAPNPYQPGGHQPGSHPAAGAWPGHGSGAGQGDATGGLIPYRNPFALTAYYLAIFSLLPCIGLLLGLPAVICGILGLRAKSKNPAIKGTAHALIGIILGGLMTLVWVGAIATFVAAIVIESSPR
jgi:hypothetical protein